jgi:hypothetical protein
MITLGNIKKNSHNAETNPMDDGCREKGNLLLYNFYDPPQVTSKSKARVKKYIHYVCTCRASGFGFYRPIMEAWT